MLCENNHNKNHNIIDYKSLIANKNELNNEINKFKNKVENIEQIIIKTRDLAKTVPSLYNKDMAKEREMFEDKFYDAFRHA